MQSWQEIFVPFWESPQGEALRREIATAYSNEIVYPPREQLYRAFELTPFEEVRVVILGQDPYHGAGQANGLAFSVAEGIPLPPSLRNIFQELYDDLGIMPVKGGDLTHWAEQGVLLLNTALSVKAGEANSHSHMGWQNLINVVMHALNDAPQVIVFVLWGKQAQKYEKLIINPHHVIIKSAHPSPLSAYRGFFGSRPFSRINQILETTIQW